MAEALLLTLRLLVVSDIQPGESAIWIGFEGGQRGSLPRDHKDYADYLQLAQRSLETKYPVAVAMGPTGKIVEMESADNDFVKFFAARDAERMEVWFQGHNGIFFLRRDHPGFKQLSEILDQSLKEKRRVWFVARGSRLVLEDVLLFREKEPSK